METLSNTPTNDQPEDEKQLRDTWGTKVQAAYKWTKEKWDNEAKKYIEMYRHEFGGTLPARLLTTDRVDVNVVYQVIKSLLPALYFKNPKVFLKPLQEKIVVPVRELIQDPMTGEEIEQVSTDPMGTPLTQEFDAPKAALKLQAALNENITRADMKYQVKQALTDALLGFYGAIKCGWGNDQGQASMGEGAPPSVREQVYDDLAYGIRLKPWDVTVDPNDFYSPEWISVRYCVPPEQLKKDTRLMFTEQIKGTISGDSERVKEVYQDKNLQKPMLAEYFEIFVKPCAKYPDGQYFMLSPEVKEGFLYQSPWPIKSKTFPVKTLYFNPDPEGGLPVPDMRYLAGHQKAKLNLRNTEYEYVQRTLPMLVINTSAVKDQERIIKQIQSGNIPRVVTANQPPNKVMGGAAFPAIPFDFRNLDGNIDSDIARVAGLTGPVTPTSNNGDQLATGLKLAASGEQIRQNERADVVSDFVQDILEFWVDLYKEFAAPENYSLVDGEPFPLKWTRDEIQGKFLLEVKPFSMSYEDPTIRRRQYVDLLNLLAAPEIQMQLQMQGASVDIVKIIKRVLETYDERDVETFVITDDEKPENQVLHALQENEMLAQGAADQVVVMPTDNHRVHILLHSLLGPLAAAHILEHNQAMGAQVGGGSPGGGNVEGMPINGVAANQEMMKQPLQPSSVNSQIASEREAKKTGTR